ncbi:hypothetical protein H4Q26_015541 [Puccinia striiformis f. sp. tritici PST-130]|uniref:Uncharacterized protein n=1 Tax=Puccinia striiformis f. sp. tritici PST-78 TaxID=1165861 RepID=A0A0L0UYI6_9BASI|nr:hypothetical protein H4Q26_015541 [Puccinia striiformis f. sp. tritici PST-130]KNE91824.1 hypothetical protein PSTG_14784 [Puccinia striiformis f. sp. tritici PST-78]
MISITVLEEFTNFRFFSDLFAVLISQKTAIIQIYSQNHAFPPGCKTLEHTPLAYDFQRVWPWAQRAALFQLSPALQNLWLICIELGIDQCIGSRLKGLGDLSGVLNGHLQKLSIQSFYLIHFFALQDDTETSPIVMPPLIRPTLGLAEDIQTDQAELLECIQRNIECIERINVKWCSHRRALVSLHEALHFVQGVHSSLENCRQSLRLYPWGLHFANEIANSSGRRRFKAKLAWGLGIIQAKNLDSHSQLATGLDMHDDALLQM